MCKEFIKSNNKTYSPCNVVMCSIKSHASAFPSSEILIPALEKLLPEFDKSKLRLPQVKSINAVAGVHTSKQVGSQSTGMQMQPGGSNNISLVAVDSHTGKFEKVKE